MKKNDLKLYLKEIYKLLFKLKEKLLPTKISKLRLIIVLSMLIKTILFVAMLQIDSADKILIDNISFKFIFVYLAFILLVYSFGYLLSKNIQTIFYIIFDSLYSVLLVLDLCYFRINRDLLGLKNLLFKDTFNPMGGPLFNIKPIDTIFIIDIFIIVLCIIIMKIKNTQERNLKNFLFTLRYSILIILISIICVDILPLGEFGESIIHNQWTTLMEVKAPGPLGHNIIESSKSLFKFFTNASREEKEEINDWLAYNKEEIQPNEYSGIFKGKNVIFLQIESLENFVINKTTNGKEITPFLNKLTKEGLYFNNIYEQNNAGNSIDCDFMINTSLYPLGDKITALNYGENIYANSLPRILGKEGYTTISSHAELPCEFNWSELHKNSFGAQKLWSIRDYNYDEVVGYGLSDKSFLSQTFEKLKNVQEPFFLQLPTLSSHGPFNIDKKYRQLDLPTEVDESNLGGYFESVLYTDNQLEMFYNELDKSGLLDNTVLVIYGDHTGVHKYYKDNIENLDYENNWWKDEDHKIPLIIYSKGVTPNNIKASGGQTDILPTICYLLGVNDDSYRNTSMGRILVNTNRDAITIKGNTIVGNVKSDEEKEHILKAYEIGSKIIKNNYFSSN
ncbi:LTA synthase family protein [Clostridium sp. CTA-5]